MAFSARTKADCKEFFDSEDALNLKIKQLAELIRNSNHFCAFTGAGISTAAGIADFRSGINTVLDTGTGKWAAQSARKEGKSKAIKKNKKKAKSIKAIPTASHMALVSLATTGPQFLKCLISQNTDGLHRRSGVPLDRLCELHGNTTLEVCDKCGRGYMRDYRCRNSKRKQKVHDHKTGRRCTVPKCRGYLHDTIINFNEDLKVSTLEKAQENTDKCDVMLALGSSLTVTPAADLPEEVGDRWAEDIQNGKNTNNHLVIVNLQKTPLDDVCSLRIFAKIDDVMVPLMKELGLHIPEWTLQRFLKLKVEPMRIRDDMKTLTISAVDIDGINATVFRDVKLRNNGKVIAKRGAKGAAKREAKVAAKTKRKQHPIATLVHDDNVLCSTCDDAQVFAFDVPSNAVMANDEESKEDDSSGLVAEITFFGNYSEPNLCVPLSPLFGDSGNEENEENESTFSINKRPKDYISAKAGEFVCRLQMNIATKQWTVGDESSGNGLNEDSVEEVTNAVQTMDLVAIEDADDSNKAKE
jgi:NAD-dependent SIR2 family protein deacetylase